MGLAPGAEAGGAPHLAPGPGGEPRGRRGERSVGGRGRGSRAGTRDRAAGRRASRRRRVVGGVDPPGRGARAGAVPGHGAQPARTRAVAARAAGGRGAGARRRAVARLGARLVLAGGAASARAGRSPGRAAHHGAGRAVAPAHAVRDLQLGHAMGDLPSGAARDPRPRLPGRVVHRPHRGESERPVPPHAGQRGRDSGRAGGGPASVRGGARAGSGRWAGAAGAAGASGAAPRGDGDRLAAAQARDRARLKSDAVRGKRVPRLLRDAPRLAAVAPTYRMPDSVTRRRETAIAEVRNALAAARCAARLGALVTDELVVWELLCSVIEQTERAERGLTPLLF